jgi:hypothetical protein
MPAYKLLIAICAFLITFKHDISGQTHVVTGLVLEDDLNPLPLTETWAGNHKLVGTTDMNGRFSIIIPDSNKTLFFRNLGYELAVINLDQNCNTIEIILLSASTHDFMSSKKIDRSRLKRFNALPQLHLEAVKKGVFSNKEVCYSREFQPQKPSIDSIAKQMKRIARLNKLYFNNIKIGDTVCVPFGGSNQVDKSGSINLIPYSSYSNPEKNANYDFVIDALVVDKDAVRKDLNLNLKVINCDFKGYTASWDGKTIINGEPFNYNMQRYKLLPKRSIN